MKIIIAFLITFNCFALPNAQRLKNIDDASFVFHSIYPGISNFKHHYSKLSQSQKSALLTEMENKAAELASEVQSAEQSRQDAINRLKASSDQNIKDLILIMGVK